MNVCKTDVSYQLKKSNNLFQNIFKSIYKILTLGSLEGSGFLVGSGSLAGSGVGTSSVFVGSGFTTGGMSAPMLNRKYLFL